MIRMTWLASTTLPVEADFFRPDALTGLSAAEVAALPAFQGNHPSELGEFFKIEGRADNGRLVMEGDLRHVRGIGREMASGVLSIEGTVGNHLGAGMTGGTIEATAAVGDWAGAEMRGGLLRIRGSAGDSLGSAYPGSRLGMREGVILVDGPIGDDAGLAMRRGLIAVTGPCGECLGRAMVAGSILTFGEVGRRAGAGMKRGTIGFFGMDGPELLPTFAPACRYRPPFIALYLRRLRDWGFPVPQKAFAGSFDRYNGDLIEGGLGEVLVWKH